MPSRTGEVSRRCGAIARENRESGNGLPDWGGRAPHRLALINQRAAIGEFNHIPGSGGISRLTRLIGPHWTKWLAMAGQAVDADHALRIGLVHAVYPAEEFSTKVAEFARHLAGLPSEAVGLSKLAIDAAVNADRRTSRDIDRLAQSILFQSVDFTERQQAFVNRGKA